MNYSRSFGGAEPLVRRSAYKRKFRKTDTEPCITFLFKYRSRGKLLLKSNLLYNAGQPSAVLLEAEGIIEVARSAVETSQDPPRDDAIIIIDDDEPTDAAPPIRPKREHPVKEESDTSSSKRMKGERTDILSRQEYDTLLEEVRALRAMVGGSSRDVKPAEDGIIIID